MDAAQIEKMKALALAATPGDWKVERLQGGGHHNVGIRVRGPIVSGYAAALNTRWANEAQAAEQEANAAFIAAANPAAVLELIAEVERLRADAARYRWLRDKANSQLGRAPMVFNCASDDALCWTDSLHGARLDAVMDVFVDAAIAAHSKASK